MSAAARQLTDDTIRDFLAEGDWISNHPATRSSGHLGSVERRDLLTWSIVGILACLDDPEGTQLTINADPDLVALLLFGATLLLPETLMQDSGLRTRSGAEATDRIDRRKLQIFRTNSPTATDWPVSRDLTTKIYLLDCIHPRRNEGFLCDGQPCRSDDENWIKRVVVTLSKDWSKLAAWRKRISGCETVSALRLSGQDLTRPKAPARASESDAANSQSDDRKAMGRGATAPTRRTNILELLRNREFQNWNETWNRFLDQIDKARSEPELKGVCDISLALLEEASAGVDSVPFRVRDYMLAGFERRYDRLASCPESRDAFQYILKDPEQRNYFRCLATPDDIREIAEERYQNGEIGAFLASSTLLLLRRRDDPDQQGGGLDDDAVADFAEAVVDSLLTAPAEYESEDMVRNFAETLLDQADASTVRRTLSVLLRASGDRCLPFALTLLSDGCIAANNMHDSVLQNLVDDRDCYDEINDPAWIAAKGENGITSSGLEQLLIMLGESDRPKKLWLTLCRGFDKRLLLGDKIQLRRFQIIDEEFRQKRDLDIPHKALQELDDWGKLIRKSQPVAFSILGTRRRQYIAAGCAAGLILLGYYLHWTMYPWPPDAAWFPFFNFFGLLIMAVSMILIGIVWGVMQSLRVGPFRPPAKHEKKKGRFRKEPDWASLGEPIED